MSRYIYKERIVFCKSVSKTLMRCLKFVFLFVFTIPCQIAFLSSKKKKLVYSDFGTYWNFVKTIIFSCHNRNLFYHRMGRTSLLYSWILRKDETLKLPFSCSLGRHVVFVHNNSCYLNAHSIGDDFICYPHVVIGTKNLHDSSKPVIGNNVTVGTGAVIVGNIAIGNNVCIGANTFVCQDIPSNSYVTGNPMKIFIKREKEN